MRPIRVLTTSLLVLALVVVGAIVAPSSARAAPTGASGSASVSTSSGARSSGRGSKYKWPELAIGNNGISVLMPLQIGIVGYLPKARFGVQYDRQIRRAHWIQFGAAMLFDRGSWHNFRMSNCGLTGTTGACGKGGVAGFDIYAGYSYKFYIRKLPFIVPIVRGNLGFSYFALPKLGGGDGNRLQSRTQSWTLNVRPGGGLRVFLLENLAIGGDINIPIGFLVHTNLPLGGSKSHNGQFLLGVEILPLVVQYQF